MHDVEQRLYTTVIREMIRHENDVTNHRIMWLLIVQGLIANAYVNGRENASLVTMLAWVGILVTLSAFVILYKSYQARGYLEFLGNQAKRGTLKPEHLPLFGWPRHRIKGWRQKVWICPCLGQPDEVLEPYIFLPSLLVLAWLFVLLRKSLQVNTGALLVLAVLLTLATLTVVCVIWVWWQSRGETET